MKLASLFTKGALTQEMTASTIESFFAEVDADPRAGLGSITKQAMVIDKIIAQHRIVVAQLRGIPLRQPMPIMDLKPMEVVSPLAVASAKAAKAVEA